MNGKMNYDKEKMAAVWQRVTETGKSEPTLDGEESLQRLRNFMMLSVRAYSVYSGLFSVSRDKNVRAAFQRLAEDERRHIKQLQLVHFLRTGDSFKVVLKPVRQNAVLPALRAGYIAEAESAQEYLTAAGREKDKKLAKLYSDISAEERTHVAVIESLIMRMLG